jgi:hypothetical protein
MLFSDPDHERRLITPRLATGVAVLATIMVLAVGVWPELLAHFPPLSTLVGQ